jgi:hypothetical protein
VIVITIECCGCGKVGASRSGPNVHAHELRAELRRKSWLVGAPGGVDLCPKCQLIEGLAERLLRERR